MCLPDLLPPQSQAEPAAPSMEAGEAVCGQDAPPVSVQTCSASGFNAAIGVAAARTMEETDPHHFQIGDKIDRDKRQLVLLRRCSGQDREKIEEVIGDSTAGVATRRRRSGADGRGSGSSPRYIHSKPSGNATGLR